MNNARRWSFGGTLNTTQLPALPANIDTDGVTLFLIDQNGAVIDDVAYTGAQCTTVRNGLRLTCRSSDVIGKLTLARRRKQAQMYTIAGTFKRRNVTDGAGTTRLSVSMMVGPAIVEGR